MKREELQRLTDKFKATHDLSLDEFEAIAAAVKCEAEEGIDYVTYEIRQPDGTMGKIVVWL